MTVDKCFLLARPHIPNIAIRICLESKYLEIKWFKIAVLDFFELIDYS